MKKVFLDTNFIMDLLARGPEYSLTAKRILDEGTVKDYQFYISFLSVANFAYITRKGGKERLKENIDLICDLFFILSNDKNNLLQAWDFNPRDYEDALQYSNAVSNDCECIITRDKSDYSFSKIPIWSPSEFLENME